MGKWNLSLVDLDEFWEQFRRIRKSKRTACIHFCSTKFGYTLIKSWEKGYKMDMVTKLREPMEWQGENVVWAKRNVTGGLQSKSRPMRRHEMVYFFYEQAPKYNRDKYHKRIKAKLEMKKPSKERCEQLCTPIEKVGTEFGFGGDNCNFEPKNPNSILDENSPFLAKNYNNNKNSEGRVSKGAGIVERKSIKDRKGLITKSDLYPKENQTSSSFDPPNPNSIVEEQVTQNPEEVWGWDFEDKEKHVKTYGERGKEGFEPRLPTSVVEEKKELDNCYGKACGGDGFGSKEYKEELKKKGLIMGFEPPNPTSIVEETHDVWGQKKWKEGGDCGRLNKDGTYKLGYEPPNP